MSAVCHLSFAEGAGWGGMASCTRKPIGTAAARWCSSNAVVRPGAVFGADGRGLGLRCVPSQISQTSRSGVGSEVCTRSPIGTEATRQRNLSLSGMMGGDGVLLCSMSSSLSDRGGLDVTVHVALYWHCSEVVARPGAVLRADVGGMRFLVVRYQSVPSFLSLMMSLRRPVRLAL